MPLYEYRCAKCGNVFEVLQKFADQPVTVHPECGGEVERIMSAPAFQFKGTGFYITDYAKGSAAGPKSESQKAENHKPEGGKSESGKSESNTKTESSSDKKTSTESKPASETKPASEAKPAAATKKDD